MIESSDIAINPETGLAIVVIKPDAFKNKDLIIKKLEDSGLYIAKTISKRLPDNFVVGEMYKDLPHSIEEKTLEHFNEGPSEIILLEGGSDLLKKIEMVTGQSTNPNECNEESIRYIFGEHIGEKTEDGKTYYRNAIHRAKNSGEQKHDLDAFENLL